MSYTKIENQKLIKACKIILFDMMVKDEACSLLEEREAYLFDAKTLDKILIFLRLKKKLKNNYSIEFHKNNRDELKEKKEIYNEIYYRNDSFPFFRDRHPSVYYSYKIKKKTRMLLALAINSDNGFVRLSDDDINVVLSGIELLNSCKDKQYMEQVPIGIYIHGDNRWAEKNLEDCYWPFFEKIQNSLLVPRWYEC